MVYFKEQSVYMKFCFGLGKTVMQTHDELKHAFADETMSRTENVSGFRISEVEWFMLKTQNV
jgi:hypothetical protein